MGIIALIILLAFIYFRYKKKIDHSKKRLPPYQQAQVSLKKLDQSDLIANRQLKDYITELTNISRRYLDEKIEVRAMEYTSSELMQVLYQKKEDKKVNFKEKYLETYQKILVQADCLKICRTKT